MLINLYKKDFTKITVKFFSDIPKKVKKIKKLDGRYWHPCEYHWILPFNRTNIRKLFDLFKKDDIEIDDMFFKLKDKINKNIFRYFLIQFDIHQFRNELRIKGYSLNTINAYSGHLDRFFDNTNKKSIDISNREIKKYILSLINLDLSRSYINQTISAIKLFYQELYNKRNITISIPRPKKEKELPEVLSKKEIKRIINVTKNYKHKALICLIYSSGLRVSEVIRLKLKHIDSDRKMVYIKDAKGKNNYIL